MKIAKQILRKVTLAIPYMERWIVKKCNNMKQNNRKCNPAIIEKQLQVLQIRTGVGGQTNSFTLHNKLGK